jgi:uncharacterized protein YndB with AHSA1/START domain
VRTIGTMRAIDEQRGAIRVEDVYATDIADLWKACTQPERLTRWIGDIGGDLRAGGMIHVALVSTATGPARIDVCEPPHHLVVTMDPGTQEEAQIEAWLTAEGESTRLIVEERGLPRDGLHFHGAGWQAHLEDLGRSLSGDASNWKDRWEELTPAYAAMVIV